MLSVRSAGVAQLVEQLICNQQVGGSSPSTSSTCGDAGQTEYGGVPEWPKGADCKSVVNDFGGSNPPSSTKQDPAEKLNLLLSAGSYCYNSIDNLYSRRHDDATVSCQ